MLEGLTIINGTADQGGAIYCAGTAGPTILEVRVRGQRGDGASETGSAIIYSSTGTAAIQNCTFAYNGSGTGSVSGAVAIWKGTVAVTDCLFVGNVGMYGAGVWIADYATAVQVTHCTFLSNKTGIYGGAISTDCPQTTIISCRLIGNAAASGGAISVGRSSPSITNCVMTGNTATSYGGGIYVTDATSKPVVTNCTFAGNTATTGGGGLARHRDADTHELHPLGRWTSGNQR